MKAQVIILTSSHVSYATRAYESVAGQQPVNFDYDVFINVNTLNPNYITEVREAFKDKPVTIVETESNGRPGKGHNSVLQIFKEHPQYDYLIMLDGDDMFYPCAFQQLEQLLEKKPDTDLAHLMINDNISTNDNDKKRIKLHGNYYIYTSAEMQENWWDRVELKNPFKDPLHLCRTPSRMVLSSRRIFESRIPIEYSEKCRLYDDFKAFLSWAEASYEKTLNVYSLSDPVIYCYNGQNDESVTYGFRKIHHEGEQKVFDEETKQYNALRSDWFNQLKNLPWVKLDNPKNFTMKDRIDFANKWFVNFEIQDSIKNGKEYQLKEDYKNAKKQYQNAERGGMHSLQLKLNLAVCYHKLSLKEYAINAYQESLLIEETFMAHRNLAMIYLENKEYKDGARHVRAARTFPEAQQDTFKTQLDYFEQEIRRVHFIQSKPIQKKISTKPILCIYTGYSPGFNGKNYQERSVWGSEIATVHLAEMLAEEYQVFVFCVCDEEIEHNGVRYLHFQQFEQFQHGIHINTMIVSRFMHFFMAFRVKAEKIFYWAHDARIHDAFQGEFLENQGAYLFHNVIDRLDGIICVSSWHKKYFMDWVNIPQKHRYKVHIIQNGIDLDYFDHSLPKKQNRMIWASNPDRGLDILLKCYPNIQKEIPDLTLDIYYSDLKGEKMPEDRHKFIVEQVNTLPGVTFHGKISEKQLCQEYCKADLFPYFNRSHETYCISALQACAGGCMVVCRNYSGLKDSVGGAGFLLHGHVDDQSWQDKAVELIVNVLKQPEKKKEVQDIAKVWGSKNTWKARLDRWHKVLQTQIAPKPEAIETVVI